ncbi:MAG: GTP 3',8-cyclase MoaA [Deltaproteobacteria bacterium]|jgi:cyclic pyranopterin phosphate synthase|nr:GTP 3',8-cyclase MoaA [Deltaproteobacteria bacterium]
MPPVPPCDDAPVVPDSARLTDEYGRSVRYLRLSVTDRCNLRCLYCRGSLWERHIPHEEVLRYEELARLVELGVEQGIEKVRLTGGEPFVRKGFMDFLRMLRERYPRVKLRLTSNGVLLGEYVKALKELGIEAINLSLDSLRPEGFLAATGHDLFPVVRRNLDALLAEGVQVKINVVAIKDINRQDMRAFMDFARSHPVEVRFIEFMPMGGGRWSEERFWPAEEILAEARKWAELVPCRPDARDGGPARVFSIAGGLGRFGLITPMSDHFCAACNRLRITSDGRLRTCLFADREYRLRGVMRHPRLDARFLSRVIRLASRKKPMGADILRQRRGAVTAKSMVSIGG